MQTTYSKFEEDLLRAYLNTANVKCVIIDEADYTFNDTHEFLSSIPVAARVATSGNLTGKTFNGKTFDAADITINGVTGDTVEAIALYVDSGVEGTSRLIAYINGLAFTPNGGNVTIQFNALGIFS